MHNNITSWVSFNSLYGYGAPLGDPSGRRSSAIISFFAFLFPHSPIPQSLVGPILGTKPASSSGPSSQRWTAEKTLGTRLGTKMRSHIATTNSRRRDYALRLAQYFFSSVKCRMGLCTIKGTLCKIISLRSHRLVAYVQVPMISRNKRLSRYIPYLLNPFWNHWLPLQWDWLSALQKYPRIALCFALDHIFSSANENRAVKKKPQPIRF